jgi:hypothetical protein
MKEMKQAYLYLTGQSQWMPKWFERLPRFLHPIYVGEYRFRWLGREIETPFSLAGDTLFMYWRRRIIVRIIVRLCQLEYDIDGWLNRWHAVLSSEYNKLR